MHLCGVLFVKEIEEPPAHLNKQEKLIYTRVCDVECIKCGQILYSQPYDFGKRLNAIQTLKRE